MDSSRYDRSWSVSGYQLTQRLSQSRKSHERWTLSGAKPSAKKSTRYYEPTSSERHYPDWLANPIPVKKKSDNWRICIDFTNLNQACPKDRSPLPRIVQLVDTTIGYELLSFMDAYLGYNQIKIHPPDEDKAMFITDWGIYCYKLMPFRLKKARATFQRMVNKVFKEQTGHTIELYVDDMVVKKWPCTKGYSREPRLFGAKRRFF